MTNNLVSNLKQAKFTEFKLEKSTKQPSSNISVASLLWQTFPEIHKHISNIILQQNVDM